MLERFAEEDRLEQLNAQVGDWVGVVVSRGLGGATVPLVDINQGAAMPLLKHAHLVVPAPPSAAEAARQADREHAGGGAPAGLPSPAVPGNAGGWEEACFGKGCC